jgi:YVTN family beta-propeller protein
VATIPVGSDPDGMAYDGVRGEIFVSNAVSDNVSVISDRTDRVVASVPVGGFPLGVAYDPGLGEIAVANEGSDSLTVISDATTSVIATVLLGGSPRYLDWDSALEDFAVSDYGQGTLSLVAPGPPTYLLTVQETGLLNSLPWYLNVSGEVPVLSMTDEAVVNLTNASYSYTVATPDTVYHPSALTGQVLVNGSSVVRTAVFLPTTYGLEFIESGLPNGTPWSLILNGVYGASGGPTVEFTNVTNGSFYFGVDTVPGYVASPVNGTIEVTGPPLATVPVAFSLAPPPPMKPLTIESPPVYLGVLPIVGVGAVAVVVLLWRRGRRRPNGDWYSAPEVE